MTWVIADIYRFHDPYLLLDADCSLLPVAIARVVAALRTPRHEKKNPIRPGYGSVPSLACIILLCASDTIVLFVGSIVIELLLLLLAFCRLDLLSTLAS